MPTQILDPGYFERIRSQWESGGGTAGVGGDILFGGLGNSGPPIAGLQAANLGRIPRGAELEAQSSDVIEGLLNPPEMFADVDRQAAEMGASRGVSGSAGAFGVGLRLTDEERLKRMALGENFLTQAYGRQPTVGSEDVTPFIITPYQREQLDLERERLNLQRRIQERESGLDTDPQYFGPLGFTPTGGDFQPAPGVAGLPSWITGY